MESILTQLMFDIPSDPTVEKVVITAACVNDSAQPEIVYNPDKRTSRSKLSSKNKTAARRKVVNK